MQIGKIATTATAATTTITTAKTYFNSLQANKWRMAD